MRCSAGTVAAGIVLAGMGLAGMRQPEKPPAPDKAAQQTPEDDRAALRARLERRLEEAKRVEDRIQAAIKRLDQGEAPSQIQADVGERGGRPGRGFGAPGRFGHERGPGDRGGQPDKGPDARAPHLDTAETLGAIEKFNPAAADRLRTLVKDNPAIGARIVGRLEPQVREIQGERDDKTRELRIAEMNNGFETLSAMRALGDAVRAGQPTTELESKLKALIGEHFDLQLKLREREITKLEDRLKQLHEELDQRRPQRDKFVSERVEQIKRGAARFGGKGEPRSESPGSAPRE